MDMGFVIIVRRVAFALTVLAVLGTLPVLHLLWRTQPTNTLDVLVFDVSVADADIQEHAVLDRIFENERVT